MINKTPEKPTGDSTQDALTRSHNLLLALSRAAQSIQQARTAGEVYHAVGDQIKSLGGDVCLFMINADRQSLTVAHTSYAPSLIRRVEKILRASVIGYRFALAPDSKYVRNITTGKTIYVQQAKKYVAATLPKDTYSVVDQFMSILKIEQGIFAPLRVDDETLGLMIVCGLSLNKSDVPAMESFAGQIAVSLQNVRLTQQMQNELSERKRAEEELRESESQLRILFEQMAVGVARIQTQTGRFVQINQKYCDIVGYSHEEMVALDFQSITHPQDLQADLDNMEQLKSGVIRDFTMEKRYIHKNGSLVWVALTVSPMWMAGAVPDFHIAIVQDISARKAIEAMLVKRAQQLATVTDVSAAISANLEQEQLLQSVVDLSKERFELYHAHIYLFDKAENALILKVGAGEVGRRMVLEGWRIFLHQERSLVARAARERIGVIANDVRRNTGFLSHPLLPDTRAEMAVPIIVGGSLFGVLDVQANNVNHFTEDDVRIMTTLAAQIAVAVQNARLFSEHRQVEEELRRAKESLEVVNMELRFAFEHEQHMARTDTLTGINNRRNLFELAEHEFEVAKRYQQPLSIIMFDLDHFKTINDTYGHSTGDKMLEHVAQITHAQLRDVDIIGRYGGEEFVIVLPVTNAQKASLLAQRILENVSAIRLHTDHGPAAVTLSIGIAKTIHEPQDESVEDVIRRADEAMYAAKQAGRNRAVIFDAKQQ